MDKSNLKIVSCMNCKNLQHSKIDKSSSVYSCKLDKDSFDIDKLEVLCNKPCFKEKSSKRTRCI